MSLNKNILEELYNVQKLSMAEMAARLGCSPNKIVYWMVKHGIQRRNISEAIYQWRNADGNPFKIHLPESEVERELFFIAIGLYVGEGKKRTVHEVSLANTNPQIVRIFLRFLREICGVDEDRLWAWINIFDDAHLVEAQTYWEQVTGLSRASFYKPIVRPRRGGSYLNLSQYGTVTVGVSNTKLCEIVKAWCQEYLKQHS